MVKRSSGYTSQGKYKNVSRKWLKLVKRERDPGERLDNQWKAFSAGKNVILTVPNFNKEETNKRFVRVPANHHWKDPNYKPKKASSPE